MNSLVLMMNLIVSDGKNNREEASLQGEEGAKDGYT